MRLNWRPEATDQTVSMSPVFYSSLRFNCSMENTGISLLASLVETESPCLVMYQARRKESGSTQWGDVARWKWLSAMLVLFSVFQVLITITSNEEEGNTLCSNQVTSQASSVHSDPIAPWALASPCFIIPVLGIWTRTGLVIPPWASFTEGACHAGGLGRACAEWIRKRIHE